MEKTTQTLTRRENAVRFIKFGLFSISAGAIQVISFKVQDLLLPAPEWYWMKYILALVLSVVYNFTLNRRFTFRSVANYPLAMMKVACYYAVFAPVSTWWGNALALRGWNQLIILLGTMVINFLTEFLFQRFIVFGKTIDTNAVAQKKREKDLPQDESDASSISASGS